MTARRTLHVTEPACEIRKVAGRLVVAKAGKALASVTLHDLEAVHVSASAQITTQALLACTGAGVRVCFYRGGRLAATIEPEAGSNVLTRIAQVDRLRDVTFRNDFVAGVIGAKLAAAVSVVGRWRGHAVDGATRELLAGEAERLGRLRERVAAEHAAEPADSVVDRLRGLEGLGAVAHFRALAAEVRHAHGFACRRHHPPPDPVNAALSFGYVLLASEVAGRLTALGLDTGIGLLHGLRSGRDSLALDVIEPYRPAVVDAFVARLFTRRELGEADFAAVGPGVVHLADGGRRRFLERWEAWLQGDHRGETVFGGKAPAGTPPDSWRHALRAQAVAVRRAIIHRAEVQWLWQQAGGEDAGVEARGGAPGGEPIAIDASSEG